MMLKSEFITLIIFCNASLAIALLSIATPRQTETTYDIVSASIALWSF